MIYGGELASDYGNLTDLEDNVQKVTQGLYPHLNDFDSIAVQGVSGLLVGAPAALRLKKPLVVVRKACEQTHDFKMLVNEDNVGKRVLFLDDFVASGETRARVRSAVERTGAKVVAQFEYYNSGRNFTQL